VIEGSLRDAAFTDVLQIVVAGRKDGVLHLERDDRRARVWITAGRLVAASVDGGVHLGEVLVRLDLLGVDEVQELLAEQAATPGGSPSGQRRSPAAGSTPRSSRWRWSATSSRS
jgi:hypothetical protein